MDKLSVLVDLSGKDGHHSSALGKYAKLLDLVGILFKKANNVFRIIKMIEYGFKTL